MAALICCISHSYHKVVSFVFLLSFNQIWYGRAKTLFAMIALKTFFLLFTDLLNETRLFRLFQ